MLPAADPHNGFAAVSRPAHNFAFCRPGRARKETRRYAGHVNQGQSSGGIGQVAAVGLHIIPSCYTIANVHLGFAGTGEATEAVGGRIPAASLCFKASDTAVRILK